MAYLDHNATAPVHPAVMDAMVLAMRESGNPSSVHRPGRTARRRVEEARAALASRAGCRPAEIIFTSGGTEANNLALAGLPARWLLWAATEHDSVRAPALSRAGAVELPVDGRGILDLEALARALAADPAPALVAVMLANNETGVIQPIAEIAAIVHGAGGLLHCDAVQAFGKIPVHMGALHADSMSLSAHKVGGPPGVGALVIREGLTLAPSITGGGQELRRRAGTENVPGIVGFGAAADLIDVSRFEALATLRDGMEAALQEAAPDARVFGASAPRLPNTTAIAMPGVPSETQVMALDLAGVCVSAGSACSSGKVQMSHVLQAMGAGALAGSSIRISLGRGTGDDDISRLIDAWSALYVRTCKAPRAAVS